MNREEGGQRQYDTRFREKARQAGDLLEMLERHLTRSVIVTYTGRRHVLVRLRHCAEQRCAGF